MLLFLFLLASPAFSFAGTCTEKQYSVFESAVIAPDPELIKKLAAETSCLKNKEKSLLYLAAEKSDFPTFKLLIDSGADVNARNIGDGFCHYQILHVVQAHRKTDAFPFVKAIVDAGADLNSCATDDAGHCGDSVCDTDRFPLGQAAAAGDLETVTYLVDRKARIAGDELFYSAPDDARITERLLALGANPSISQNAPLFRTHSAEAVKLLVKAGADINFRQYGYGRAIPLAIYSKPDIFLLDPVIAAIDAGADLRLTMTLQGAWPCVGVSALLCWAGQLNPTSLLAMYHGLKFSLLVDLEQTDAEGETAIMRLSRYYMFRVGRSVKTEVLKLLIARGANLNAADKQGKNVLAYFRDYPRENAREIALLVEAGAR